MPFIRRKTWKQCLHPRRMIKENPKYLRFPNFKFRLYRRMMVAGGSDAHHLMKMHQINCGLKEQRVYVVRSDRTGSVR